MLKALHATAARLVGGHLNYCDHGFACTITPVPNTEPSCALFLPFGHGKAATPIDP